MSSRQTTQLMRAWQEPASQQQNTPPVTETALDRTKAPATRRFNPLLFLGIGTLVVAVFVTWLIVSDNAGGSARPLSPAGPELVSQAQLKQLAAKVGHPVYWAGPKARYSYEVTVTKGGRFYVRYLPEGVKAGDPRPSFLVVGTYTEAGSFAGLKRASKQDGSVSVDIPGGGLSVFAQDLPTSVYFAYPRANYQVEVYSPSGDTARGLVFGDSITPVPAP